MSSEPSSSKRRADSLAHERNVDTTYVGAENAVASLAIATANLNSFLLAGHEHRLQSVEGRGVDTNNYKNNSIFTPTPAPTPARGGIIAGRETYASDDDFVHVSLQQPFVQTLSYNLAEGSLAYSARCSPPLAVHPLPPPAPPASALPQKRYHIPFNPCLPMSATSAGGGGMLERPPIFSEGGSSGDCVPMIGARGHAIIPSSVHSATAYLGRFNPSSFSSSVADTITQANALNNQNNSNNNNNNHQHTTSSGEHTHGRGHHGHGGGDHQRDRNEPFVIGCCPMIAVPTTASRGGGGHTAQRGRGRHHQQHNHYHHHDRNRHHHPYPHRHQHDNHFSRGDNYGQSPSFSSALRGGALVDNNNNNRLSLAINPSSPFFSQYNQNQVLSPAAHQQPPHEREQESTHNHDEDDSDFNHQPTDSNTFRGGRGGGRHLTRTRGGGPHYLGGGAFAPTCPSFGYDFPPTPYSAQEGTPYGGTSASFASASGHGRKRGGAGDGPLVVKTAALPPPPPTEVPPPRHTVLSGGSLPPPPSHCCNTEDKAKAEEVVRLNQNSLTPSPFATLIETPNATAQSVSAQNRAARGPPEPTAVTAAPLQTESTNSSTLLLRAEEPEERATVRDAHHGEEERYSALTPGCCPIIGGGGGSGSGARGRGRGGSVRRADHTNSSAATAMQGGERARGVAETRAISNSGTLSLPPPAPPASALPQKRYHIPFNPCLPMSATSAGGGGMLERPPTASENAGFNTSNSNNNYNGKATNRQPLPTRGDVHVPSTSHQLPRRGVVAHRSTRAHVAAAAQAVTDSDSTPSPQGNLEVNAAAGSSADTLLVHQPLDLGSAPTLLPSVSSTSSSCATTNTSTSSNTSQNISEVTSGGVAPPGGVPTDGWGGTLLEPLQSGVIHDDGDGRYGYRGAAEGSSSSETVVNGLRDFEQWEWEWRMSRGSRGRGGCWCPHSRGGRVLGEGLSSTASPLSFSTSAFVSSIYPPATAAEPRSGGGEGESAFSLIEKKKSFGNSRPVADAELMSSTAASRLSPLTAASTSATVTTSTTATSNRGVILNEVGQNLRGEEEVPMKEEGFAEVSVRWAGQGQGRAWHRQPSSFSSQSHSTRAPLSFLAKRPRRKGDIDPCLDEEDAVGADDAECSTVAGLSSLAYPTQANSLLHHGGGGTCGSEMTAACFSDVHVRDGATSFKTQQRGCRHFGSNTDDGDSYRRGLVGEAFGDDTARGWHVAVDEDAEDEGEEHLSSYHTMLHGDRCRESDTIIFNVEDKEDTFFTDPLLQSDAYSAALERYQREIEQKEICGRKLAPYRRPKVNKNGRSKNNENNSSDFPFSSLDRKMGIEWEIVETRMAKGDEDERPNTMSSPPRRVCPCPRFGHTAVVVGDFSGSSAAAKEMLARRGVFSPFSIPSLFSSSQNEGTATSSYCASGTTDTGTYSVEHKSSTVAGGSTVVYQRPSRFYPSKEQRKELGLMPPRYGPARSTCTHSSPPQSPPPPSSSSSAYTFALPVPLPPNLPPMMLLFGGRSDTTRQGDVWAFTIDDETHAESEEEEDAAADLETKEETKAIRRYCLGRSEEGGEDCVNEERGRGGGIAAVIERNSEANMVRVASAAAVAPYPLLTCDEDDLNFRAPPHHRIRSYVYSEEGRLRQQQEQQLRQEEDEGNERQRTTAAVASAPHSSATAHVSSGHLSNKAERKEGTSRKSGGTKGTWRLLKRGLPFSLPPLVPTTELPSPPPRCGHATIASSKGTMVIFGGSIADDLCTNDCWEYSLTGFYGEGQGGVGDGSHPYSSNLLNTFTDNRKSTIRTTPTNNSGGSGGPSADADVRNHFSVGHWRLRTSQGMYEDDLARQKKHIVDQYTALLEAYQKHVSAAMQQQQQSLPKTRSSGGPPPPPMQQVAAQRPPPPPRARDQAPPPPPPSSLLTSSSAPLALQQFVLRHQNTTIGSGYPLARKGHTFTAVGRCHAVLIGGCNPCLRVGSPTPIFSMNPLAPTPSPWPTYTIASIASANEDLTRTVWTLNFDTNKWRSYIPLGVGPRGRTYHVAAASCARKSVFVFGGVSVTDSAGTRFDNSTFFNDLFELVFRCEGDEKDRGPPLWRKIETTGGPLPSPRMCSSIILKGHKLVMFMGGARELARDSDAYYELDTQTFKWRRVRFLSGHPPCSRPTTVLLDNRIVSFGGALDCHGGFSNTTYALTLQAPTLKALCREWLRHKTSQVDLGEGAVPNHIDRYLSQNGGDFGALEGEDEDTDFEEEEEDVDEEEPEALEFASSGLAATMSDADDEDGVEEDNAWRGGEGEGEENEHDEEEDHDDDDDDDENEAAILLPYLAQDATEGQ